MKITVDPSHNLHEVLYDTRLPTSVEVPLLKEGIKTMTERIAQLRQELADLEDLLYRHHAALSPIRRLPLEMLGTIFGHTVYHKFKEEPSRKDLANLTLVCKTWRDAALTSIFLWSTVAIDRLISEATSESVARWLGRSKTANKTLIFTPKRLPYESDICHCVSDAKTCKYFNSNFLSLLSKVSPVYRLVLKSFELQCLEALLNTFRQGQASPASLRSLEISVDFHRTGFGKWPEAAERFQNSILKLSDITELSLALPINWLHLTYGLLLPIPTRTASQLTTFSIECEWLGAQVITLLQHCSNVEHLTLQIQDPTNPFVPTLSKTGYIELAKVHTLVINAPSPLVAPKSLRLLRFPNLSTLWVRWSEASCRSNDAKTPLWLILDQLNAFAPLSRPPIRTLHVNTDCRWPIHPTPTSAEDLTKALSDLPDLITLSMSATAVSQWKRFDPVDFLHRQPKVHGGVPTILAPNLERWELVGACGSFDLGSFLQYLKSRQPHHIENGKVVLREPKINKLKMVQFTNENWGDKNCQALGRSFATCSADLEELRSVFGIAVERFGNFGNA